MEFLWKYFHHSFSSWADFWGRSTWLQGDKWVSSEDSKPWRNWGKPFADAKDMKQIPSIPSFPSSDPNPYMPQQLEVILPVLTKSAFTTSIKLATQATWSQFLLLKTPLCEKSHSKVSNILIRAKNSAKPNALRSGKSTITTVSHMMEGFLTILAESLNICYNYKLFHFVCL